jgi:preprotein translocase subunit SecF
MRLFPVGKVYDFMGKRVLFAGLSIALALVSLVLIFYPGPKLGTDFKGGTEVEVEFKKPVDTGRLRSAIEAGGFAHPDVIPVATTKGKDRYLIRVQEVSVLSEAQRNRVHRALCQGENLPQEECPEARQASEVKFSPGGDKISVRFRAPPDLEWIKQRLHGIPGVELRAGANNPLLQNARDNKVEVQLKSKGDQLMDALRSGLGADTVPEAPLRVEWIGPKAGAQLRDGALRAIAISIVFIMAYIAFRFDLRFAPGAVFALVHDTVSTVGVLILLGKELNLTTVAAILTILGYSVNDTVTVFDRVRENMGRLRGASFPHLINVSLSEMLDRTVITGGTGIISLLCFFIWGTGALKEFALTLIIGILLGLYSSLYVALPFTEWLDRRFFSKIAPKPPAPTAARRKSMEAGTV